MSNLLPQIAPYASKHAHVNGMGDSRPTALQIVQDQGLIGKMAGTSVAISGGDGGLGLETTRALYATGAHIIMLCMDLESGKQTASELQNHPNRLCRSGRIDVVRLDLGDLATVRQAAQEVKQLCNNRLDVLICNAGVMSPPIAETHDGFEPHIGINFFGHFALFNHLLPALLQSRTHRPSRVVVMSSLGHRLAKLDLNHFPPDPTHDVSATAAPHLYHDSKLALLWMATEIDRRYASQNIRAFAVNPGSIPTQLTAHIGWDKMRDHMGKDVEAFDKVRKTVEQGAATTVWAAVGRELEGHGGLYLDDVQVAEPAKEGSPFFTHGYAPHAYDAVKAQEMWDIAARVLRAKGQEIVN